MLAAADSRTAGREDVQPGLIDDDTFQLGCKTACSDFDLRAPTDSGCYGKGALTIVNESDLQAKA